MAAPTADQCAPGARADVSITSALKYASYDAGSDTKLLPFPSRRIITSVDMTLAVVLMDGATVSWACWEKIPEDIVCKQIMSTGSTLNSGTIKVYF
jgi:hypothetical protein